MSKHPVQEILLSDVFLDRETQIRVAVSEETVQRYYDIMVDEEARDKFPPIVLFRDGNGRLWLVDGHHRVMAAKRRKFATIRAIIIPGTKEDAVWEAIKANSQNGLPLLGVDIRRAVGMVLEIWPDRSNVMIAEAIGCNESTVRRHRDSFSTSAPAEVETTKRVGKDGKRRSAKRKKKQQKTESADESASASTAQSSETERDCDATTQTENIPTAKKSVEIKCRGAADAKEQEVIAATDALAKRIDEWFAVAPNDMWEGFDQRNNERIGALIH